MWDNGKKYLAHKNSRTRFACITKQNKIRVRDNLAFSRRAVNLFTLTRRYAHNYISFQVKGEVYFSLFLVHEFVLLVIFKFISSFVETERLVYPRHYSELCLKALL